MFINKTNLLYCICTRIHKQTNRYKSHKTKLFSYMEKEKHIKELIEFIPEKHLDIKRHSSTDTLYLIDSHIAREISKYILPCVQEGRQIIAETGAGLGLVASELLDNGIKQIRLYEACPDFRSSLYDFHREYPNRVELFKRNIFHLSRISFQDKYDRHNRVFQLLKDVPRKEWHQGPCMTIFGCMTNTAFIRYLLRMLAMQAEIALFGRLQLFVIMRPSDYVKLSAGPEHNLHTYQTTSVLFNLLFKHNLIDKYPREAFLPWETKVNITGTTRSYKKIDVDQMYLVKITSKRTLPVPHEQILPLYFFVKQCFGRGKKRIIPTVEKWIPGCGLRFILPSKVYKHYYDNMSIYTTFGQLCPQEILSLFQEMIRLEGYAGSSFAAMIQSELIKYETRETDSSLLLEDSLEFEDLEEKFE